ncbi:MAG: hypothetical protein NZU63_14970 [Gemmataceae bacterium]|nr:hypothetical protein [Gemmataceae bacterium]
MERQSESPPQYYHPTNRLLDELTQLWPWISPHLQAHLLQLARLFASHMPLPPAHP